MPRFRACGRHLLFARDGHLDVADGFPAMRGKRNRAYHILVAAISGQCNDTHSIGSATAQRLENHAALGDYVHNRTIFWASERIYWPDKGVLARKERILVETLTTG